MRSGRLELALTQNEISPQPFVLRGYQVRGVADIRRAFAAGAIRVAYVLPTGGGKTIVFSYILAGAARLGRRILILAHRREIVDQIEAALIFGCVHYGIIAPGHIEVEAPVQIASIATLARRLERWRDQFDFVVVDECHHAVAGSWAAVLASQPQARIVGVTATPERLDGRGLGELFNQMIVGPSTAELIAAGFLAPYVVYEPIATPDLSGARVRAGDYAIEDLRSAMGGVVVGAAVSEYQRLSPGVPAVAFCVDIAHSKAVAERFRAAGVKAAHIDGDTPAAERRAAIAALGDGGLEVITNHGLISEGVDVPAIGAVLMLRPTASLALHMQMIGRALRPAPGKDRALILDFAGNVARHGLPDAPRTWSLDSKPRRQREASGGPRLRRCPSCTALNRAAAHACAECGCDLRTPKERVEIQMALREAERREVEDAVARMNRRERLAWAGSDETRLRFVGRLSGYRPGWVFYRMREMREMSQRQVAG